jgi:hypothetical protein
VSKTNTLDEAEVLRFFEEASIEKAETVFNIVSKRFRQRLATRAAGEKPRPRRSPRAQTATPSALEATEAVHG